MVALSLASGAMFAAAATAPPATHLQKGEWTYHSVVRFTSGPMAGRTIHKDTRVCVKSDRTAAHALMPHAGAGDTTCSRPTLSYDAKSYHTAIRCVTRSHGMTSRIQEDFILRAGDKGTTFQAHGKVDQQLMIQSMPARKMHMSVEVDARRTGTCPGMG